MIIENVPLRISNKSWLSSIYCKVRRGPSISPSRLLLATWKLLRFNRRPNSVGMVCFKWLFSKLNISKLDSLPNHVEIVVSNELFEISKDTKFSKYSPIVLIKSTASRPGSLSKPVLEATLRCWRFDSARSSGGMLPMRLLSSCVFKI